MIKKFFLSALLWMTALSFAGCQAVSASAVLSNPASSSAFSGSSAVRSPAVSSSAASLSETPGSTPFGEMMSALSGYQQGTAGSHL